MNLTEKELEKLKNITILQLAIRLEDGLVNACTLREDMSVFDFIKTCLDE